MAVLARVRVEERNPLTKGAVINELAAYLAVNKDLFNLDSFTVYICNITEDNGNYRYKTEGPHHTQQQIKVAIREVVAKQNEQWTQSLAHQYLRAIENGETHNFQPRLPKRLNINFFIPQPKPVFDYGAIDAILDMVGE